MTDFQSALQTKKTAKSILEDAGIKASYLITVTDSGPRIRIQVAPTDLNQARALLPYSLGPGEVTITDEEL